MNLPAVIAHEQRMPMGRAFARMAEITNADMRAFVDLAERLLAQQPEAAVHAPAADD